MSGDDENADPNMSMFFQNMSHPILPNKKRHRNLTEFQRVERKECKSKQKRKTCTYYNHRDNDEWTFFYFVHRSFVGIFLHLAFVSFHHLDLASYATWNPCCKNEWYKNHFRYKK